MKTLLIKYAMLSLTMCLIHNHNAVSMDTKDNPSKSVRPLPSLKPIEEGTPRTEPHRYRSDEKENSLSHSNAIFELEAFVTHYTSNQAVETH